VQGLEVDLLSFCKLLYEEPVTWDHNTRTRGGLLNLLGHGMKYLFGRAFAYDVKRLHDVCDELHGFKLKMTHAIDHQLTYIRTLDGHVKQNTEDIASLTEILRYAIHIYCI
jgi:hypothetical protein